ncbi:MAG: helix-turn-helix transcriptional regulator [Micromonosporaceae bacterium]|nr:helix-turn-helix transcriptional regulator [Micromonosporaceae bacterium]
MVQPRVGRDLEDLTARARIRDAAIELFADRGAATTIRDIARAAGVSAGLVRHHFGSKDALREACDAFVLDRAMSMKEQVMADGFGNPAFLSAAHPTILLTYRYVARALIDGSAPAAAMFDELVRLGTAWFERHDPEASEDLPALSAVIVAMHTGLVVMHEHLARNLGADVFELAGYLRMSRALIDLYSRPLLDDPTAAAARSSIDKVSEGER